MRPGSIVDVGGEVVGSADDGTAEIRLLESERLRGHIGMVEVRIDGSLSGEVEITPDKMSRPAYDRLRIDLHAVWTGLALDPHGPGRLQGDLPPARELWRRIERPVHAILDDPRTVVVAGVATRRAERVRRSTELTSALVRQHARGRPGLARVAVVSTDTPEQAMLTRALRLLRAQARRRGEDDVEQRLARLLRHPVLPWRAPAVRRLTWGMRSDARYRQILDVYQMLERPQLAFTEGPGDLRLGVQGLVRLYEYWVFLQVLRAAEDLYGPPIGDGYADLAVRTRAGTARLELPAGTTVTFPGPVHVGFEPHITARGDGWQHLEYVPHPDPDRPEQLVASPDVVVLRVGERPWATVIDAKYVGRPFVEREAARLHDKYARIRLNGISVVHHVLAAHPHEGFANLWAGYGHVPMTPGLALPTLPLPRPYPRERKGGPGPVGGGSGPVVVLADQAWMQVELGDERLDLDALAGWAANGAPVAAAHMIVPTIEKLNGFASAATARGWRIRRIPAVSRGGYHDEMLRLIDDLPAERSLVLITGDDDLAREASARRGSVSIVGALRDAPRIAQAHGR